MLATLSFLLFSAKKDSKHGGLVVQWRQQASAIGVARRRGLQKMVLHELPVGQDVTIKIKIRSKSGSFQSCITEQDDIYCWLAPILSGTQMVNIDRESIDVSFEIPVEGKGVFLFENLHVRFIGGRYRVLAAKEGRLINHRKAKRFTIDRTCTVITPNGDHFSGLCTNVSMTGFAVSVSDKEQCSGNLTIDMTPYPGRQHVVVSGDIMRHVPGDVEGETTYGCQVTAGFTALGDFIMWEQRRLVQGTRHKR